MYEIIWKEQKEEKQSNQPLPPPEIKPEKKNPNPLKTKTKNKLGCSHASTMLIPLSLISLIILISQQMISLVDNGCVK